MKFSVDYTYEKDTKRYRKFVPPSGGKVEGALYLPMSVKGDTVKVTISN